MRNVAQQGGFSLIELLVVLVILGLLAGIVGPKLFKQVDKGKWETTNQKLSSFKTTLDLFRLDVGRYPSTDEGLLALQEKPGNAKRWNGPYLDGGSVPLDGWEQEFHYKSPGDHGEYDLFSYGSDNAEGAPEGNIYAADIISWK